MRTGMPDVLAYMPRHAQPLERWSFPFTFEVRGITLEFVGERWVDEDAEACPYREHLLADPRHPGESCVLRLVDPITGETSFASLPGGGREAAAPAPVPPSPRFRG